MATITARKGLDENDKPVVIGYQAIIRKRGQPSQTKTFRTKRDAERWARQIENEMDRGVFQPRAESERTTVNALMDRYAREVLPTQKGGHREVSRVKHVKEGLGQYSLAALTSSLIADYRDARLKIVGPQSVKHELGLLQRALKKGAQEWGIALPGGIPTFLVKKPSLPASRNRRLVDDEEDRLLTACADARNPWLRSVVVFAIETAMRAGEIVETWKQEPSGAMDANGKHLQVKVSIGLLWENVDLKKRTAHLPKTKNGEARTVPLSSRAVTVLDALPRSMSGRVFGITYEAMKQAFDRACKRAGIDDLRFHDLRHEAVSRLFEKGFNPMEVSTISGHKTLQMLKRYTHLRAEDLAKRMG